MASNCDFDEDMSSKNDKKKLVATGTDTPEARRNAMRTHQCPECPKKYKNKGDLTSHRRIHDKNQQIKCNICHVKVFATVHEYEQHMLSHTGKRPHECPTCNRCFGQLATLKNHQYTHMKEKTFKCSECPVPKYFKTPNLLYKHSVVHKKVKEHECSICHMKFHRRSDMIVHKRAHTQEKEFQCGICLKRFTRKDSMKSHIQTHIGLKPYNCVICEAKFTTASNLAQHRKNCAQRMEKRPLKCPKCIKRYGAIKSLNVHMKKKHKETAE